MEKPVGAKSPALRVYERDSREGIKNLQLLVLSAEL